MTGAFPGSPARAETGTEKDAASEPGSLTPAQRRAERLARRGPTKQQLVSRLTIDKMMELWPWGPPQALPQYRYWELSISCDCANRSHRRKDCPVRGMHKCHICGRAFEPTGTLFQYCAECLAFWEARRDYLARWAAENTPNGFVQGQLI